MKTIFLIAGMCLLLIVSSVAEGAEVGRYTAVEGRIDVVHPTDETAIAVKPNDPVFVGDIIRSKSNSRAEITFKDDSKISLAPSTRIAVKEYDLSEADQRENALIKLYRGKFRAVVSEKGRPSNFHISTPTAKGTVKGTDIFVFYRADATGVLVKDGLMSLYNPSFPGVVAKLRKGNYASVPLNQKPTEPRPYIDAELTMHEKDTKPAFVEKKKIISGDLVEIRGKITSLSGEVRILRSGEENWHQARVDEVLSEGDKIQTSENGSVEITLENGNILHLQAESEILLKRMRQDAKTGEYDNTFESKFGKIKAVVERLGKQSTFEVKTPTAVCGVRGTIMYLDIQPTQTTAFYEGGYGVMTNLTTGDSELIGSGENSTSDAIGNISVPIRTNEHERIDLDKEWGVEKNVEDYSTPQNRPPDEMANAPITTETKRRNKRKALEALVDEVKTEERKERLEFFNDIPYDEVAGTDKPPTETTIDFTGKFAIIDETGAHEDTDSIVKGDFSFSIPSSPTWDGQSAGQITGVYRNTDASSYKIWLSKGPEMLNGTASDGGRFAGRMGGTMIGGVSTGKVLGVYIDPSGYGGTFSTLFSGGYNSAGEFDGTGTVKFNSREDLGVPPGSLDSLIDTNTDLHNGTGSGTFNAGGTISIVSINGEGVSISDRQWGIWFTDIYGTYTETTSNNWTCAVGGLRTNETDTEAWIGSVDGVEWCDRSLQGTLNGYFFNQNGDNPALVNGGKIFNGDVVGHYEELPSPTWEAIGGGEWVELTELLTESGLGFTMTFFEQFVSVPFTETHHAVMNAIDTGSSPGFINATMDTRFYMNENLYKIWAGDVSGAHDGSISANWTLNLTDGANNDIALTNGQWSGGQWVADVSGQTSNGFTFDGQAGGTYDTDTFQGVGGGTYENVS